jgi:hypothetical protein
MAVHSFIQADGNRYTMDLMTSKIQAIKDEMWDAVEVEEPEDILLGAMAIVEEIIETFVEMFINVEKEE